MPNQSTIYLDYAAATPIDEQVLAAMQPYFTEKFYNPSATYLAGSAAHKDLETARGKVAQLLGARPSEITFTAGGTEANNLAIHGIMQRYPGANLVVSAIEHESILRPAQQHEYKQARVTIDGVVDIEALTGMIDEHTVLVSIMYANNEVGTIQAIHRIAQVLEKIRKVRRAKGNELPLYLHSDACQAAGYLDLHTARLGVDLMTLNGGKIYGPKQSGILYVRGGIQLNPLLQGGGQERNIRSGTENLAGAVGFATALDIAQSMRHAETKRLQDLQQVFYKQLEAWIPGAVINGSLKKRLPNNVHITIPGKDNERLLMGLDEKGIMAAAGSACSASDEEPSHVLKAMGIGDDEAQASLRFTMGRSTTKEAVERTVRTLAGLIA